MSTRRARILDRYHQIGFGYLRGSPCAFLGRKYADERLQGDVETENFPGHIRRPVYSIDFYQIIVI